MYTPIVSIIVPIYNAENYLRRCLDSIVAQTFKDFEAILVDDGSADGSGALCDEFAAKDVRFKVVHQENSGVSVARQTGMDVAQGKYVIHADSDDWVEKDWITQLVEKIEENDADIAICDFDKILRNKTIHFYEDPFSDNQTDMIQKLLSGKLWGTSYNKLVRRELFAKYDIRFIPSMCMWEDLYVSCRLLMNPLKIAYVPKILYHYDFSLNSSSLCKRFDEQRINSAKLFVDLLEPHLSGKKYSDLWFWRKSIIKTWAFRAGYRGKSLQDIFPEINNRYIKEAQNKPIWNMAYCVSFYLKDRPKTGWFFYQLANIADIVKRALRK